MATRVKRDCCKNTTHYLQIEDDGSVLACDGQKERVEAAIAVSALLDEMPDALCLWRYEDVWYVAYQEYFNTGDDVTNLVGEGATKLESLKMAKERGWK